MRVTRSSFIRNLARFGSGGGVRSKGGTARLVSCRFVANETRSEGGAVNSDAAVADLINCLFSGNVAQNYGGGVACAESDVGVINCTFSANTAAGGDAVACSSVSPPETRSTVVVVNSILWDSGSEIYNNDGSSVGVTYSTLYGSWPGVGNLSANPRFLDLDGPDGDEGTEDDDLTLKDYSPCIDAGSNAALPVDILTDLAGKTRRIDDPDTSDEGSGQPPLVDMGAYEYGTDMQGQHPPVAHAGQDRTVYASGGGTASVVLDGSGSYDPDGSPLDLHLDLDDRYPDPSSHGGSARGDLADRGALHRPCGVRRDTLLRSGRGPDPRPSDGRASTRGQCRAGPDGEHHAGGIRQRAVERVGLL